MRLAGRSGESHHREQAVWALKSFPNSHRHYGAFAAGFGHALARLLALPRLVTVSGIPGGPEVRAQARAALNQHGQGDVVMRFREDRQTGPARPGVSQSPPATLANDAASKGHHGGQ